VRASARRRRGRGGGSAAAWPTYVEDDPGRDGLEDVLVEDVGEREHLKCEIREVSRMEDATQDVLSSACSARISFETFWWMWRRRAEVAEYEVPEVAALVVSTRMRRDSGNVTRSREMWSLRAWWDVVTWKACTRPLLGEELGLRDRRRRTTIL
jgi:hypothetical protein